MDNFSGTTAADTFTADNTGTANTASTADSLNGGEGIDTLNIFSDGTVDGSPTLVSVETVSIYDKDDAFDISGQASVTTLNIIRGEGDETFTVGAGVAVGVTDLAIGTGADNAALTLAMKATDTSATVTLNGVTAAGNDANEDLAITGAALTTVNISTTGVKSAFDALDVAAAKTVNLDLAVELTAPIETTGTAGTLTVTGAGAAKLGALDTGFTTVDASESTGGLTITDQAAATVITGSATAANHVNVGVLAKTGAVTLGASTADRIEFTDDTAFTTTAAKVTGAEILRVAGVGSSYDLTKLAGITSIEVGTTGGTVTLNKLSSAQANAITAQNSITTLAAALSDTTGTADSVTVTIDDVDTTAGAITIGALNAAGVETLNIVTGDTAVTHVVSALTSSTSVKTLNVSGTSNLTISDATAMAAGATVDATDFAKNLNVTIGAGDIVLAGAGDDTVNAAFAQLGNTTKVSGGAGDDTLNITGNGMDMVDADFALITGVDNITIASATTASLTLAGFAQGAIATVDKNTDGLLDITAAALTGASTIDASAMISNGVDVTITNTDGSDDSTGYTTTLTGGNSADKFTITIDDTIDGDNDDALLTNVTGNDGIDIISFTLTSGDVGDILTIISAETATANADIITGFTENSAGSVIDYNGTVQGTIATDVDVGTTLAAAIGVAGTQSVYVVTTDVANSGTNTQGTAFNDVLNSDASNLVTNFDELVSQILATSGILNGTHTGLDADVTASEAALIVLDNGTGSVIMRLTNTTATGNTVDAAELALVGVITDAAGLVAADFI